MNDNILRCVNLHKSYAEGGGGKLRVLKGLNIEIAAGEFLSIIGPSGAGKSTLLHLMGGLDEPDEGSVHIHGEDIFKISKNKRARMRLKKIGFVFQFYHLLPELNVIENVALPLSIARVLPRKAAREKAVSLLEEVGMGERLLHKPPQLSGGEAQRVAIARALILEPEIVLCDEPTGNLDSQTGAKILDLLLAVNEKRKRTFVIVSHDKNIADRAHRVLCIKDGVMIKA